MAATAVIAGIAAGSQIIGGLIASSQAKARANFQADIFEQEARKLDLLYGRKLRAALGTGVAQASSRGVANIGSALDAATDAAFDGQFESIVRQQDQWKQAVMARVTGQVQGQSAIIQGISSGIANIYTAAQAHKTSGEISRLEEALNKHG